MACVLKAVVRDIRYTYQGYPHDDEELEITAWDGDRQFPIGNAVKVLHSAGDVLAVQREKLAEKFGAGFATDFLSVFVSGGNVPLRVGEDDDVYNRRILCNRETTGQIIEDLKRFGIPVMDKRSEKSKTLSADVMKLYHCDRDEVVDKLIEKETSGKLGRKEVVAALTQIYDVCVAAADYYANTYCEYEYRRNA